MNLLKSHKIVNSLPVPLEADSIYYVKSALWVEMYITNKTWTITANKVQHITWDYLVTNWTSEPTLNTAIIGGEVYNYTLNGTTRYRFVPTTYNPTQDAFYSTFASGTLSNLIVTRG